MTDNDGASRLLKVVEELREWMEKAEQYRVLHLQTMLTIAACQPTRAFRITRWDRQQAVGCSLAIHTDPDTGDTVYVAIPEEARAQLSGDPTQN